MCAKLMVPTSLEGKLVRKHACVDGPEIDGTSTLERWRSEALSRPARERAWIAAARFDAVLTSAAWDSCCSTGHSG